MSVQRFGMVDIDGLWQFRKAHGSFEFTRYRDFEERKDVQLVGEQWFRPVPGSEYVAANPMEIPQLRKLIADCATDAGDVVFQILSHSETIHDPFQSLSPELRSMLLEFLGSKDVANLRLGSKSFSATSNILQEPYQAGDALGLGTSGSGLQQHGLVHSLD